MVQRRSRMGGDELARPMASRVSALVTPPSKPSGWIKGRHIVARRRGAVCPSAAPESARIILPLSRLSTYNGTSSAQRAATKRRTPCVVNPLKIE